MNQRPTWCPHTSCVFKLQTQDVFCGGELPSPEDHDGTPNTHRICIKPDESAPYDLQVNATDLEYMRWIFDSLDGKATSWLSRRSAASPVALTPSEASGR
jgi:hypothetical protein